jgi:hypothetical protein
MIFPPLTLDRAVGAFGGSLTGDSMSGTYAYCRICGREPKNDREPMNHVVRFWEPDDGWVIGALCPSCQEEYGNARPNPTDFAFSTTNTVCDDVATDEDPTAYL